MNTRVRETDIEQMYFNYRRKILITKLFSLYYYLLFPLSFFFSVETLKRGWETRKEENPILIFFNEKQRFL